MHDLIIAQRQPCYSDYGLSGDHGRRYDEVR